MRRVLIVKLGAIGDVLMLVPAVRALQQQGSEIEWLCGEQVAPLLALYPWITPIAVREAELLRGSLAVRLRALLSLWRRLAGRKYDLVATVYYDRRYQLLTRSVRAGRRLALSNEDRRRGILPGRHHSDEFVRLLLEMPDDVRPQAAAPVAPLQMPESPVPRVAGVTRVTLVPGGAHNLVREDALRRWPVSSFVAVARGLLEKGHEVFLAGGPSDQWASAAFAGLPVRNCIGQLSLVQTLGLIHASDVVVTPDTGPLHLAGLTEAGIVAIFGPTAPHTFLPQRPGVLALWGGEGFACRPCYDGKDYAPCRNNACVQQISPGMVLGAVDDLLRSRREGGSLGPGLQVPLRGTLTATRDEGKQMAERALFLDRDGVINEEIGYLIRPEDVRFVPGIVALGETAKRLGYRLVVVTNQSGIARGYYTEGDFTR